MNAEAKEVAQARFRITHEPWMKHVPYQVESMCGNHWSYLGSFASVQDAEQYIAARLKGPTIVKEYT